MIFPGYTTTAFLWLALTDYQGIVRVGDWIFFEWFVSFSTSISYFQVQLTLTMDACLALTFPHFRVFHVLDCAFVLYNGSVS